MKHENKVFLERTFSSNAKNLFRWLTQPELILQWFGPQGFTVVRVKCDLRLGGSYSIEMKKEESSLFKISGEYTNIRAPFSLEFTYRYSGLTNPPPDSTVSFRLVENGRESTTLIMVQEFKLQPPHMESRSKAWNFMFDRLFKLI